MKDSLLNEITKGLDENLQKASKTYEGLTSKFVIKKGASKEDISSCNAYFNFKMPNDYQSLLLKMNGCVLFNVDDIGGFSFFGCDELIKENTFQKVHLEDEWDENIILICSCLGDGDYIGLKVLADDSYEIIDCFHEEVPSNWRTIGSSLDDFLERLTKEKGKKFWLFEY